MKMRGLLWVFVALLGLVTSVNAQDYRARVQGQVVDESKGALPGATVTLTNVETGVAVSRTTDGEGRYLIDFVDPGTYTLMGELDGFRRA
ncbi:MAG: carboxypeptidase regulatory-like domain-containing protein, partial [Acidobacteria bacterium]|nr:carboxypeptidase regulatory-like domain-containing protein [Acidobacteriota bacterium]